MEEHRAEVLAQVRERLEDAGVSDTDAIAERTADQYVEDLEEKIRELMDGLDGSYVPRGVLNCEDLVELGP